MNIFRRQPTNQQTTNPYRSYHELECANSIGRNQVTCHVIKSAVELTTPTRVTVTVNRLTVCWPLAFDRPTNPRAVSLKPIGLTDLEIIWLPACHTGGVFERTCMGQWSIHVYSNLSMKNNFVTQWSVYLVELICTTSSLHILWRRLINH